MISLKRRGKLNYITNIEDYTNRTQIDWNKIIDDFTPYIKKIINNMVGDSLTQEDKEEILLDVFFVLWRNKDNIQKSLNSYIAGITRNLVKEKLKKKKVTYDISDYENNIYYDDIETNYEEIEAITMIEKEFKNIKKIDLDIINMFYYSSMSLKEIAKKLNVSEFNVANRLSRVRKKIKKTFISIINFLNKKF